MSGSKHTPGPWAVKKGSRYSRTGGFSIDSHGHWLELATIFAHIAEETNHLGEANARLIAAAPDLLAACEEGLTAIRWAQTHTDGNAVQFVHVVNVLMAAIRKAKGEPQS